MYFSLLLLPLLNFICLLFFGRYIGRLGSITLTIFNIAITWSFAVIIFYNNVQGIDVIIVNLGYWLAVGMLSIKLEFLFDSLSTLMLILVLTISLVVHIYSIDYMYQDPHLPRFLSYLSFFTFFMIILLTANNFVLLFFGWEGVGLCSYLLISFWYNRLAALKSSIKAVLYNKLGDCSLLFAIGIIFNLTHSLDFQIVFNIIPSFVFSTFHFNLGFLSISLIDLTLLALSIAAMGKSAQFIMHPWLADAMEGPTPVSALIHAATMVTAGIYLLIRCSFLIEYSNSNNIIIFIGSLTIVFAASSSLFQYDIKKIIAYSTCSQLGYMFSICAFSGYHIALYHLFNHGFFKALLFLGAGLIIHNFNDEQDYRKMGGLINLLPYTYIFILIGSLTLTGTPFLSGYFSKDLIIELVYTLDNKLGLFLYHLSVFSTILTSFYSFKLISFVFLPQTLGNKRSYYSISISESFKITLILLSALCLLSLFIGFLFKDLFIGCSSPFFEFSIYHANSYSNYLKTVEFELNGSVKQLPILFSILSFALFYHFSTQVTTHYLIIFSKFLYTIFVYLNQAWFVNYIYHRLVTILNMPLLYIFYFDKVILEYNIVGILKSILKYFISIFFYFELYITYLYLILFLFIFYLLIYVF